MRKLAILFVLAALLSACSPPPKMERVRPPNENYPNAEGVEYGYIFDGLPGVGVHVNPDFEHLGKDKRSFGRIITEVHQQGEVYLTITFNYGRKSKIDFTDVENVKPLSLEKKGDLTEALLLKERAEGDLICRYILYMPSSTFSRSSAANIFIMYTEPLASSLPYEDWGPTLTPEQEKYLKDFVDHSDEAFQLQIAPPPEE